MHFIIHVALICLLTCSAAPTASASDNQFANYCGITSMYAAAKSLGVEADLSKLLDPKYISRREGSTALDLIAAAETYGLKAEARSGVSAAYASALTTPAILHVRRENSLLYNHWVLALPTAAGVKVLDPMQPELLQDLPATMARSDGVAILIRRPDQQASIMPLAAHYAHLTAVLALVTLAVGGTALLARRWPVLSRPLPAAGMLAIATGLAAGIYTLAHPSSFAYATSELKEVHSAFAATFAKSVSVAAVHELVAKASHGTILIDARYNPDYAAGHLPGAINLPPSSTDQQIAAAVPDKSTPVILYCQSASCPFDEELAAKFIRAGYTNVSLMSAGFEKWEVAGGTIQR